MQLASQICQTPVALVSLVANDRQWFKARIGFAPCETELNSSVCAHALVEPDVLVIPDLTLDGRSEANPLVTGQPHIRFYAGAPFHGATGEMLGSLCVIDTKPRPGGLTDAQVDSLRNLARQVTALLEMRRAIVQRDALTVKQRGAEIRRYASQHLGDSLRELESAAQMTRAAASIVGQALGASRVGFSQLDGSGDYLPSEPDWTADTESDTALRRRINDHVDLWEGLLKGEPLIIEDVSIDPRTSPKAASLLAVGMRSVVNIPIREHGRTIAVLVVHDRNPREWSPEILAFLYNVADRLEASIGRLRAEAEQQVLNDELSHRLKNTFAMIQAIATQTLRSVPDQEPVEAFIRRLHTLSAAHDVLLQQRWTAARLGDVVSGVVKTLTDPRHFDISGIDVQLGPRATLSLSLLLHELATNALKHGSLSSQSGRVAIAWRLENGAGVADLVLDWRESGGPAAAAPAQKGFGSKLIRMGLVGTGGVELRYLPHGFEAEFRAPLAQVQLS